MEKEIRNQRITFRISPTEKKYLEEQAAKAHMSVSSYLIKLSENKRIIVAEKVPDLYIEIRRIGVNINQIAHMKNRSGSREKRRSFLLRSGRKSFKA